MKDGGLAIKKEFLEREGERENWFRARKKFSECFEPWRGRGMGSFKFEFGDRCWLISFELNR